MIASVVTVINVVSFLIGQYLVTRRNGLGFFIWAGSNLMVVLLNIANGSFATAFMFIVYCLANLCSVGIWLKEKTQDRPNAYAVNATAGHPDEGSLGETSQRSFANAGL